MTRALPATLVVPVAYDSVFVTKGATLLNIWASAKGQLAVG